MTNEGATAPFFVSSTMPLRQKFLQEIQLELERNPASEGLLSLADLKALPELMQRYLEQSGHLGKPKALNCFIKYESTAIKLKPEREWTSMHCQQFNSAASTSRIALMSSRLFGIMPLTGIDKYSEGEGNMLIKLAGFTVTDARGPEMNKAALVTFLSESVLLPAAIINPNISWQQIDSHTLKGTISNAGITVSGVFYFNKRNEVYKFETDDRYYAVDDKNYKRMKWSAHLDEYQELNGARVPTELSAVWHLPEGDYEYFRGTVKEIIYGLSDVPNL